MVVKKYNLQVKHKRKQPFKPEDIGFKASDTPNLTKNLIPLAPNIVWASDFTYIKFENKTYRKILQLKGAGYSTTISPDGSKLTLNIGLSHPVIVNVPKNKFNITLQKSGLVIESTNKVLVGDFANKIKNLKTPDPYKGKGF